MCLLRLYAQMAEFHLMPVVLTTILVRDRHGAAAYGVPSLQNHETLQKFNEYVQGKQKSPPLTHPIPEKFPQRTTAPTAVAQQILGGTLNSATAVGMALHSLLSTKPNQRLTNQGMCPAQLAQGKLENRDLRQLACRLH